jgi:Poxvirus A32 protein.
MNQSFVGAIIGARRSGKTSLALDLLLSIWRYRFDMIVIISRTVPMQEDVWRKVAGTGVLLCDHLDMELIRKLQNFMRDSGKGREVLLICDDIGKIANFWARRVMARGGTEDELSFLAYASRHYGISLLYLSQDVTQMSAGYRKNFDFVICLEASIRDQDILFTELLSNTFRGECKAFKEYYVANTGNYQFFQIYKQDGRYHVWPPFFAKQQSKKENRDASLVSDPRQGPGFQAWYHQQPGQVDDDGGDFPRGG